MLNGLTISSTIVDETLNVDFHSINISNKLQQVIEEIKTIVPEEDLIKEMFIAGGSIRSIVSGDPIADYDIFMKSQEALNKLIAHMEHRQVAYKSKNSIGLFTASGKHLQFIIVTHGTPEQIIGEFDFTCNQNYYDLDTKDIKYNIDALTKQLRINPNARNLMGTFLRIGKFLNKGFKYPPREDMVMLGIKMTQHEPINTYEDLDESSKMNFSQAEIDKVSDIIEVTTAYRFITTVSNNRVGSAGGA